jgi:hypothetical protein
MTLVGRAWGYRHLGHGHNDGTVSDELPVISEPLSISWDRSVMNQLGLDTASPGHAPCWPSASLRCSVPANTAPVSAPCGAPSRASPPNWRKSVILRQRTSLGRSEPCGTCDPQGTSQRQPGALLLSYTASFGDDVLAVGTSASLSRITYFATQVGP